MTGRVRLVGQVCALALVAALLGLLVWKVAKDNSGAAGALAKGEHPTAPAFALPRLDGSGHLSIADLRGKAVVVNFWASWCIPCKDEAPALQATYKRYGKQGLVVLGIDVEDFQQDVTGYPETFFVDRRGRLVGERIQGGIDTERNKETFAHGVALALADKQ